MSKHNFVDSETKSTFSAFNVQSIVVENAVNRLSISLFVPEIFAVKVKSCPKTHTLSILGRSKCADTTSWLVDQSSSFFVQCRRNSSL